MQSRACLQKHKGFGALFHDKIPQKGREEIEINSWKDECCIWCCFSFLLPSKVFVQAITWDKESIEYDSSSGWPVEASSKEMCQKVEVMIFQDAAPRSVL